MPRNGATIALAQTTAVDLDSYPLLRSFVAATRCVLVYGEPGSGKSTFANKVSIELTGRPPEEIQGSPGTDETHLWGRREVIRGETTFADGPVPRAIKQGLVLVIEDWNQIPFGVRDSLKGLRDKGVIANNLNNGELIPISPDFRLIATSNVEGLSCRRNLETAQAQHDGFVKWEVPPLSERDLRRILASQFAHAPEARIGRVVQLHAELRSVAGKRPGDDKKQLRLSVRPAIHLMTLLEAGVDEDKAVEAALVNAYAIDPDAHEAARAVQSLRRTRPPAADAAGANTEEDDDLVP
jgi:nitric oxide reductase NorQ protein